MFAGKKSAQIREILISESAWEEMTCLFAPSLILAGSCKDVKPLNIARNIIVRSTPLNEQMAGWSDEEKNKIALAVYSNSNFRFVLN